MTDQELRRFLEDSDGKIFCATQQEKYDAFSELLRLGYDFPGNILRDLYRSGPQSMDMSYPMVGLDKNENRQITAFTTTSRGGVRMDFEDVFPDEDAELEVPLGLLYTMIESNVI